MNRPITVEALNYDLSLRKSWQASLLEEREDAVILLGKFDRDIAHPNLGVVCKGTISKEFFFHNHWYNVFEFREPNGTFRNYYCNISMPPTFDGERLAYVDLDIDVVVDPFGRVTILDREEFKMNAARFSYPKTIIEKVEEALHELLELIGEGKFPFNPD